MAKNAVFPYVQLTQFVDESYLKRLSFFFESIYVCEVRLQQIRKMDITRLKPGYQQIAYEQAIWEFLIESGIVKTFPFQHYNIDPESEIGRALESVGQTALTIARESQKEKSQEEKKKRQ